MKGGKVDAESNAMTTREHMLRRFIFRTSPVHRPWRPCRASAVISLGDWQLPGAALKFPSFAEEQNIVLFYQYHSKVG